MMTGNRERGTRDEIKPSKALSLVSTSFSYDPTLKCPEPSTKAILARDQETHELFAQTDHIQTIILSQKIKCPVSALRGSLGQSTPNAGSTVVVARGQGEIAFNEDSISVGEDGQWSPFHKSVNHRTLQLK